MSNRSTFQSPIIKNMKKYQNLACSKINDYDDDDDDDNDDDDDV